MNLLIRNLKQIVTIASGGKSTKRGRDLSEIGLVENGTILIRNGLFEWVGRDQDFTQIPPPDLEVLDGSRFVALPGFVDAHTHLLFAGSREDEFTMRAQGKSYQQIAEAGGGILSTVRATRAATKKELKRSASRHLDTMMRHGTTTVEIKSGYGLDPESEVKMLEAITELANEHYMTIVSTFLGAHTVPPEYRGNADAYVDLICDKMLPYVAKRRLAGFCDVFCESGYFSPDQSRKILEKAHSLGLKSKVHADELASSGGSHLAADLNAVSADHLEHIDDNAIQRLSTLNVVAVLLPGVSFFLNHGYAPARKLIDAGVAVAIATDFNPGSCMSFDMPLMLTIACTHMAMTPEEAISAATLNAAAALGMSDQIGSIEVGKKADLILYDLPNYRYLAYHFGTNHVAKVIKNGTILEFS